MFARILSLLRAALKNIRLPQKNLCHLSPWWQQKCGGYKYIKEVEGINYGPCNMLVIFVRCSVGVDFMYNAVPCWNKQGTDLCWNTLYSKNKRRWWHFCECKEKVQKLHVSLLWYRNVEFFFDWIWVVRYKMKCKVSCLAWCRSHLHSKTWDQHGVGVWKTWLSRLAGIKTNTETGLSFNCSTQVG